MPIDPTPPVDPNSPWAAQMTELRTRAQARLEATLEAHAKAAPPASTGTSKRAAEIVKAGEAAPMKAVGDVARLSFAADRNADVSHTAIPDAKPYGSAEEMRAAVRDPQYKRSGHARAVHAARLAVTPGSIR
jgi:hypothetical protein